MPINLPKTEDKSRASSPVLIRAVRAGHLDRPEDGSEPPRVVVYVHADLGDNVVPVFGEVEIMDDRYVKTSAWATIEALLERLVGWRLDPVSVGSADRELERLLAEAELEAPIHVWRQRSNVGSPRSLFERLLRRRQATTPEPPPWSAGLAAIRVALIGAVALATGASRGHVTGAGAAPWFEGTWRVGDLTQFYEANQTRLRRYACAPAPRSSMSPLRDPAELFLHR